VVNTILAHAFPNDPIVGEEDASDLRKPEGALLRERIVELANDALTGIVADEENVNWGLGKARSSPELLDAIDRGNYGGGPVGR
jgi:3'(2'), 5'-bisphosphate nucleotidase